MVERLYRGKRIDNGEWVYGDLVHIENKSYISYYYESALSTFINETFEYDGISIVGVAPFIEVDPSTVGQYTGLTDDKNGKKIFEGDIVKNLINDGIFVVKYKNSLACFLSISIHGNPSTVLCSGFEVIGNIYDSPELMEGKP